VEAAPEPEVHRALEQADSETTACGGNVAVVVVAVALGEARADCDVARIGADEHEQPGELVGRMLPVGVDAAAIGVATLGRLAVAGRDARTEAAVLPERDDGRAELARPARPAGSPPRSRPE
jgi:hypothetical protein